eukprot:s26_g30.t1
MVVLKHLVGCLCGHAGNCVSLKWKGVHAGVVKNYDSDTPMLEIFSDADWAADRQTRRSVSGSMIFFGTCLVYSSSRTPKVVSLSSAESETYAAASAVMDAILIHSILFWLLQLHIVMCLHLDSSASRGILSRKGVGRLRHLSCRVLWLQDLVSEKLLLVKSVLGTIIRLIKQPNDSAHQGEIHDRLAADAGRLRCLLELDVGMQDGKVLFLPMGMPTVFQPQKTQQMSQRETQGMPVRSRRSKQNGNLLYTFSLEGMLFWFYRRCSGREERTAANRDPMRLERYRQLKIALQEMLTFLHHATPIEYQRAPEMLRMISDLSEDKASPVEAAEDERGGIDLGAGAAITIGEA